MKYALFALSLLGLAACTNETAPSAGNAVDDATVEGLPVEGAPPEGTANAIDSMAEGGAPTDALAGRWAGVEGMYLVVTPAGEAGRYSLEMQWDLDNSGTFEGRQDGNAIAFERNGETLRLTPSDGDATGLRYLAGKQDCLTVATGEGYCRD